MIRGGMLLYSTVSQTLSDAAGHPVKLNNGRDMLDGYLPDKNNRRRPCKVLFSLIPRHRVSGRVRELILAFLETS